MDIPALLDPFAEPSPYIISSITILPVTCDTVADVKEHITMVISSQPDLAKFTGIPLEIAHRELGQSFSTTKGDVLSTYNRPNKGNQKRRTSL